MRPVGAATNAISSREFCFDLLGLSQWQHHLDLRGRFGKTLVGIQKPLSKAHLLHSLPPAQPS